MSLQFRRMQFNSDWSPWKDVAGDTFLIPEDWSPHLAIEVREKPAFEPGYYIDTTDEREVCWWETAPNSPRFRRVKVVPYDAED